MQNVIEELQQHLRAVPFVPFEVRLSNGDVFRVADPEMAAVIGMRVVVADPDGESAHVLSPFHIAAVSGADSVS